MAGGWLARRLAAMVAAGLICGVVLAGAAHSQGSSDLAKLLAEVSRLREQGKYADAIPIAERAVALARQRHGEEHPELALAMNWLASVYHDQGRYREAEPLYRLGASPSRRRLNLANAIPTVDQEVRERASRPEYFEWLAHTESAHGCVRPIRLRGSVNTVDATSGAVLEEFTTNDVPDGVIYKPCGTRRASLCPACASAPTRRTPTTSWCRV